MPTPVKQPISTVRDKKSAMNPKPMSRARMRNPAANRARIAASAASVAPAMISAGI